MHRDDPICKGRGSSQWPPSHPPVCVQKFQLKLWLTAADLGVARLEEVHSGTLEGGCLGVLKGSGDSVLSVTLCEVVWNSMTAGATNTDLDTGRTALFVRCLQRRIFSWNHIIFIFLLGTKVTIGCSILPPQISKLNVWQFEKARSKKIRKVVVSDHKRLAAPFIFLTLLLNINVSGKPNCIPNTCKLHTCKITTTGNFPANRKL